MKMVQEEEVALSRGMMVHCNNNNSNNNVNHNVCNCKHSPSATLDLLILVLVLFAGAFLLSSYFCYIFNSLSLLLPSLPLSYLLPFLLFFALSLAAADFCCGARSRRCRRSGCKGLKKAMEFDLQIQRFASANADAEIDKLPWKGGSEGNPDYECLRSELRKMAPPNGRALLLFRAPCGCPVAKLEASGPKKGKRHKRFSASELVFLMMFSVMLPFLILL
ncbi:structural constituent of ribosome [Spatholobus suberectus]|nr:structural constituent of ribosome [Spatholobus suberectus]